MKESLSGRLEHAEREQKKAEQIIHTLIKITKAVSETKDLEDLYQSIHHILGEVIDLTNFFIAIYDKKTGRVSFPYFVDQFDSGSVYSDQINEENSLTGTVISGRKPVFFTREELEQQKRESKIVGTAPLVWIGIPLMIDNEVIGVMAAQNYENPDIYDKVDFDTLISVSGQVALAIERKRNEQALIESEKKYRTIIETIDDGYFELNLQGDFTFVNTAMCQILGEKEADLLGTGGTPSDKRLIKQLLQPVDVNKQMASGPVEFEFHHKSGDTRSIEAVLSAILNEAGRLTGYRGVARDITHRKIEEKTRKHLEEQLHQAHRLESLGTLAGGIAHDFNNLLMGIQGKISLMQVNLSPEHPHHSQLQRIEDYVQSAAALTSRLLGFARGGKYELRVQNLNSLVENTIEMFGRTRKGISIHTHLHENLPAVEIDINQIEQVVINLLVNASQAMDGGGDITISSTSAIFDDETAFLNDINPGQYIKLMIEDTGTGMDNETVKKIFDPFFTTKEMGGGTGLGLAMVYGILKNHSGAITVESEPGQGTCFTIYLPVSSKQAEVEVGTGQKPEAGCETILLVDDEPMITEVGKEMIAMLGYEVETASSGLEALEKYKSHQDRIDMIIIDMIMPKMSGGELFDKLKEINPDVAVLLSSGYSVDGEARQILDRGCRGFIQKPFNMAEISGKIREILND